MIQQIAKATCNLNTVARNELNISNSQILDGAELNESQTLNI